jgi:hypothetical protein
MRNAVITVIDDYGSALRESTEGSRVPPLKARLGNILAWAAQPQGTIELRPGDEHIPTRCVLRAQFISGRHIALAWHPLLQEVPQ